MKKLIMACLIGTAAIGGSVAMAKAPAAKEPVKNVSPKKHPNIAAAQKLASEAFDKITAAQKANEFDMEGHAAKAKDLLEQANAELKKAAEEANEHAK